MNVKNKKLGQFRSVSFHNRSRSQTGQFEDSEEIFRFDKSDVDSFHRAFGKIVSAWSRTLENHCMATETLFGKAECPWDRPKRGSDSPAEEHGNERVIISTLTTAISRDSKKAVMVEEMPIQKGESKGRCDLWCSLSEDYSFYLEAKMTGAPRKSHEQLEGIFFEHTTNSILTRAFRDYQKSHGKLDDDNRKIVTRSPYWKFRKHKHHVIAFCIATFKAADDTFYVDKLKKTVVEKFRSKHPICVTKEKTLQRNLARLPTTGLIVNWQKDDQGDNGFVAAFSLMGSYTPP